jgi:hypothetical protein
MRWALLLVLGTAFGVLGGCATVTHPPEQVAGPPAEAEWVDTWFGVGQTGRFAVRVQLDAQHRGSLHCGFLSEDETFDELPIAWRRDRTDPYAVELASDDGSVVARMSTSTNAGRALFSIPDRTDAHTSTVVMTRLAHVAPFLELFSP